MPSVRTRNPAARRRPPRGAPSRPGTQELSTGKHSATGRDKPRTQQPGARPRGKHKGLVLVRGRETGRTACSRSFGAGRGGRRVTSGRGRAAGGRRAPQGAPETSDLIGLRGGRGAKVA